MASVGFLMAKQLQSKLMRNFVLVYNA